MEDCGGREVVPMYIKRVALRCEKTNISYSAIVSFACALILVKSVHTA